MKKLRYTILCLFTIAILPTISFAWHNNTHLAIAKAAGYEQWFNAAGADIAKLKAGNIERFNHHFKNNNNIEITPELVFAQVKKYNDPKDPEGHLYGAIIAAVREYKSSVLKDKYTEYHIAYAAHYIGDLSNPLHNVSNDSFNRSHHNVNDGIVENDVLENLNKVKEKMYPITLSSDHFEADLAKEIARIASISRQLGLQMKKENRDMTKEEAYTQLGHSSSLLHAVLKYLGKAQ